MRKTTLLAVLVPMLFGPMMLGGLSAPAMAQDWQQNDRSVERQDNNDGRNNDGRHDNRGYNNRGWQMTPQRSAMIRADIEHLDGAINRSADRRTISPREAQGLRMQARVLKRMYWGYSRNGLDRNEVYALEQLVNQIRGRLQMERRDWNNWRG